VRNGDGAVNGVNGEVEVEGRTPATEIDATDIVDVKSSKKSNRKQLFTI